MSDAAARRTAIDTGRSFIVQAPAGSGKTELLIQRYLALLATVEVPEQIIAITFTRKAAAEMRGRVLSALREAADDIVPAEAHRLRTRELARAVLARDRDSEWDLAQQPPRLRINTLDALNAWLAQQLPILSGGVAGASVVEDARQHYLAAARALLERVSGRNDLGNALRTLLHRLDNRVTRLESLLAGLLPRRDHWLPYLAGGDDPQLRESLEAALERLIDEQVLELRDALPDSLGPDLVPLLRHAARSAAAPRLRERLSPWRELHELPQPAADALPAWQGLADLLLTLRDTWRLKLGADLGFGTEHPAARAALADLIGSIRQEERLRVALAAVRTLPPPRYTEGQWRTLAALRLALRHLTAELRVAFAERGVVDFVEIALAAQRALGALDAPSELLLALDQSLQHILVDEFQDTSHGQLKLLGLLTAGWQPGDGRTLFLVGDPMQSIYRFRNADMSLFLKVKDCGVGDVRCEPLALEQNFRSGPPIIEWVNTSFREIFPERDDPLAGAARFHGSAATRGASADQGVDVHALRCDDPRAEVTRVVEILADERRRCAEQSIAILVQSRSHLVGLHEELRASGLPVHAVEIDAPNQHQVVQDLIGLTRALTHLADRVAWLSVLRAPWCGLTWRDLHELVWNEPEPSVWELINDRGRVERLSADGRRRLLRTRGTLQAALGARADQTLAQWLERTWMALGGPACVDFQDELDHAERFFLTLNELDSRGDLDDPAALEEHFVTAHGQGEPPRESGIEIMTIHRAKGLEFDTVILLGLGREPRPEQGRGLYWLERVAGDGRDDLLLAPLASATNERDPLAELIKGVDRQRELAERARLLYVATTRAKDRLHLVGRLAPDAQTPPARSLLACLWSLLADAYQTATPSAPEASEVSASIEPRLRRLAEALQSAPAPATRSRPADPSRRPEFQWAGQAAAQVGTVVHAWLQSIAEEGPDRWDEVRIRSAAGRFRAELQLLGVDPRGLDAATSRVIEALSGALDDPRGRWALGAHRDAASELSITVHARDELEHLRLDRTFVDEEGSRWIVDFKTSAHEGGAPEAFLDSEVERYREQLDRYAAVMSRIDGRPVRVALYFPLMRAFRAWVPEGS
jgi:ATP-dependent exoDNAse (exonuclease V) beta subunit